jgi:hypothetical protein
MTAFNIELSSPWVRSSPVASAVPEKADTTPTGSSSLGWTSGRPVELRSGHHSTATCRCTTGTTARQTA